jgi:hypothetical protein
MSAGEQDAEEERSLSVQALESMPLLTRTVFLLHRLDDLPYNEIAWRCGVSPDEVMVRMTDAILLLSRGRDGRATFVGRVGRALLPLRDAWATARKREGDRRLAPWYSPGRSLGRRKSLEWAAWLFEMIAR